LKKLVDPKAAADVRTTLAEQYQAVTNGKLLVVANFLIDINALHLAMIVVDHGVTIELSKRFSRLKKSGLVNLREVVNLFEEWMDGFKPNETATARGVQLDQMISARITMHKGNYTEMSDLLVHSGALKNNNTTSDPKGSNNAAETDNGCEIASSRVWVCVYVYVDCHRTDKHKNSGAATTKRAAHNPKGAIGARQMMMVMTRDYQCVNEFVNGTPIGTEITSMKPSGTQSKGKRRRKNRLKQVCVCVCVCVSLSVRIYCTTNSTICCARVG
jgi:hypothetical protein